MTILSALLVLLVTMLQPIHQGGFYDSDNVFFLLVRVSLTQDVNLYISNTVQYAFVNDHRVQ